MAIDLDGNDRLAESNISLSSYPFTLSLWFNVTAYPAADPGVGYTLSLGNNSSSSDWWGLYIVTAGDWGFITYDGSIDPVTLASSVSTGEWHHICASFTNATTRNGYFDGSKSAGSTDSITPASANDLMIGQLAWNGADRFADGIAAEIALYSAALDDSEVAALAAAITPLNIRPESLNRYWPLIRNDYDDLIAAATLTPSGDPTVASHPRIFEGVRSLWSPKGSAAAGEFFQSVAGTQTSSGTAVKVTSLIRAGAQSSSGVVAKVTSLIRAGAQSSSGAVAKVTSLIRAGTQSSSGTVATLKTFVQAIAGTQISSGTAVKITNLIRAGSQSSSGALAKITNLIHAGTQTSSGALAKITNLIHAGTQTSSGALAKITGLIHAGTQTSSGALAKITNLIRSGSQSSSGVVAKVTSLIRAGTQTSSGTIATIKTFVQAIAGTQTSSGTAVKQVNLIEAGTQTSSGTITKDITKLFAGIQTTAGNAIKKIFKALAGAMPSSGDVASQKVQPPTGIRNLTLQARSSALTLTVRQ